MYGGLAEFAIAQLTVLADLATSVEDVDVAELKTRIQEIQEDLAKTPPGDDLDRAIALLDHYKSIHITLAPATAF